MRDNYIFSLIPFSFIKSVLSKLPYLPGGGDKIGNRSCGNSAVKIGKEYLWGY